MLNRLSKITALTAVLSCALQGAAAADVTTVADEIRTQAVASQQSEEGHPLPLAAHWTSGVWPQARGWAPDKQMELIAEGHHLLPWFQHPNLEDGRDPLGEIGMAYYEGPLEKCRALNLPVSFVTTEWDYLLSEEPNMSLSADKNPNVVTIDGKILKELDPFGPVEIWRQTGRRWTDNAQMRKLQELYPDPPRIIFLSNNEHPRLLWTEAEKSARYMKLYGAGRDDNFKRKVIGEGFIERYRALQEGMRDGLVNQNWKEKSMYIGYETYSAPFFARWPGWYDYTLYTPGSMGPGPLMWDGSSSSYYTHNWNPSTDYTVSSPQIEFMNCVFQLAEAYKRNPEFWYELSIWDGSFPAEAAKPDDKVEYYKKLGQTYTPERYGGYVQFGMWLIRPRVVREFRMHYHPWDEGGAAFMDLVAGVDRVYTNETLREWWKHGTLVPNHARTHPYQSAVPKEYGNVDRWFLLDADCNPREKDWESFWTIPVFSLALTRGEKGHREWLVYAHAPLGDRKDVTLTVPSYGPITVDVTVGGSFYVVSEKDKTVTPVQD